MLLAESCKNLAEKGFQGHTQAVSYDKFRPSYSDEALDFIITSLLNDVLTKTNETEKSIGFQLLELGAGTGKFTQDLLRKLEPDVKYLATDPSEQFLKQLQINLPGVPTLQCAADKIPLPDNSIQVVLAAQCFHWFCTRESVLEIQRVLKPNGKLIMIWNLRDTTYPFNQELEDYLKPFFKNVPFNNTPECRMKPFENTSFSCLKEVTVGGPCLEGDINSIVSYISTQSVLVSMTEPQRRCELSKVQKLVESYFQREEKVCLPFKTDILWRFKTVKE